MSADAAQKTFCTVDRVTVTADHTAEFLCGSYAGTVGVFIGKDHRNFLFCDQFPGKAKGFDVQWLDDSQISAFLQIHPELAQEVGTNGGHGGTGGGEDTQKAQSAGRDLHERKRQKRGACQNGQRIFAKEQLQNSLTGFQNCQYQIIIQGGKANAVKDQTAYHSHCTGGADQLFGNLRGKGNMGKQCQINGHCTKDDDQGMFHNGSFRLQQALSEYKYPIINPGKKTGAAKILFCGCENDWEILPFCRRSGLLDACFLWKIWYDIFNVGKYPQDETGFRLSGISVRIKKKE